MLRGRILPGVLAIISCALVVTLPSEPWTKRVASGYAFEVAVDSEQSGLVQLYYDLGSGLSEKDSVLLPIVGGQPKVLRFDLPIGKVVALRFDPLQSYARMTISGPRIADRAGKTYRTFKLEQFHATNQIDSLEAKDGKLHIVTTPGGNDPQLTVALDRPIVLDPHFWFRGVVYNMMWIGAVLLALEWAVRSPRARLGSRASSLLAALAARPAAALFLVAAAVTVIANYPILFFGRTLVTPNYGAAVLYSRTPFLPGVSHPDVVQDSQGADIAALMWQHVPWSMTQRRALLGDGQLPLWNRYDSAGLPLLGQGQSAFGDPLQLLPIVFNSAAWAWDVKFIVAKLLFAFGLGLCVWRAWRHLPAAVLTTASAAFVGEFIYRINHPAIFSLCYAPWILVCWLGCLQAGSRRTLALWLTALIGANMWEMSSGTVKEAYVLVLCLNLAGGVLLALGARSILEKAKLLAALAAAGAIFAAITAPMWLTFYDSLKHAYTTYDATTSFQLQPGMLIGLFDEVFYRTFQAGRNVINPSANFFILIGMAWCVVGWRAVAADRTAAALALAAIPALALVYGVIAPAAIARVPFLGNIMHVDNTFSCVLIILFAVLAGFGWKEAWERLASARARVDGFAVFVLVLLVYLIFLGTAQTIVRTAYANSTWGSLVTMTDFVRNYGWMLVGASALFLASLYALRQAGFARMGWIFCACAAFFGLHWRLSLHKDAAFPLYTVRTPERVNLQGVSTAVEFVKKSSDKPFRVIGYLNDMIAGWQGVYGLEGTCGADALVNPYYRQYMDIAGVARIWDWRYIVQQSDVERTRPFMDALNVRYYMVYYEESRPEISVMPRVHSSDMDVYESPTVWPRAFFTDRLAVYDDPQQFGAWIRSSGGKPLAAVQRGDVASLGAAAGLSGDLASRQVRPADHYALTTNDTSFSVEATGPGVIVLTEAYEKDNFRVTLNGAPVPYLRVNHAFKGIAVDHAGTYQVRFEYRPRRLTTALALSWAGMGALGLGLWIFARRPPPESNSLP